MIRGISCLQQNFFNSKRNSQLKDLFSFTPFYFSKIKMDDYFLVPPSPYSEILKPSIQGKGGLYLGQLEVAEDFEKLKKLRVGAIVSIVGYPLRLDYNNQIKHLYLEAYDKEDQNIEQYFDISYQFINESLKKTNVLVHCQMGISRSSSIVIAYLMMKNKGSTFSKEFSFVKSKRECAYPNLHFQKQLTKLEKKLTQTGTQKV